MVKSPLTTVSLAMRTPPGLANCTSWKCDWFWPGVAKKTLCCAVPSKITLVPVAANAWGGASRSATCEKSPFRRSSPARKLFSGTRAPRGDPKVALPTTVTRSVGLCHRIPLSISGPVPSTDVRSPVTVRW